MYGQKNGGGGEEYFDKNREKEGIREKKKEIILVSSFERLCTNSDTRKFQRPSWKLWAPQQPAV
jgi:hypothetical protein